MNDCVFSSCRTYRYSLHHRVEGATGDRLLMGIGLNPSKGNELMLDATLRILRNLTLMHGCSQFVMTNLFAFCATDPHVMLRQLDPVGPDNDATLCKWAERASVIICCWGAWGKHLRRDADVKRLLAGYDLRCLALTAKNMPRHPLRLARSNKLLPLP